MAEIKAGDRVRIKDRSEWPSPPGYNWANSEGLVIKAEEPEGFEEFFEVQIEKSRADIDIGTTLIFRLEALERI